ncbi:RhuM family protein [Nesterenkonia populi]|uniref:RhuM family protein n=1 Tax=Nesterenkonia populi TaxID=1591087 RepID=UPI0011BD8C7B
MCSCCPARSRTSATYIQNVYGEGELKPESSVRTFRTVRTEGARQVGRDLNYYSLDMLISVGYRLKSATVTKFRI